jgi:hypothetical protein
MKIQNKSYVQAKKGGDAFDRVSVPFSPTIP